MGTSYTISQAVIEDAVSLAEIFFSHLNAHPEYISHGEMQMGVGKLVYDGNGFVPVVADGAKDVWMRYIQEHISGAGQCCEATCVDAAGMEPAGGETVTGDADCSEIASVKSEGCKTVTGSPAGGETECVKSDRGKAECGKPSGGNAGSDSMTPSNVLKAVDRNGNILGFTVMEIAEDGNAPFGVLCDLLVAEEGRCHGIGTALMNAAQQWMLAQGVTEIYLESGKENHNAHAFFVRRGFLKVSEVYSHSIVAGGLEEMS